MDRRAAGSAPRVAQTMSGQRYAIAPGRMDYGPPSTSSQSSRPVLARNLIGAFNFKSRNQVATGGGPTPIRYLAGLGSSNESIFASKSSSQDSTPHRKRSTKPVVQEHDLVKKSSKIVSQVAPINFSGASRFPGVQTNHFQAAAIRRNFQSGPILSGLELAPRHPPAEETLFLYCQFVRIGSYKFVPSRPTELTKMNLTLHIDLNDADPSLGHADPNRSSFVKFAINLRHLEQIQVCASKNLNLVVVTPSEFCCARVRQNLGIQDVGSPQTLTENDSYFDSASPVHHHRVMVMVLKNEVNGREPWLEVLNRIVQAREQSDRLQQKSTAESVNLFALKLAEAQALLNLVTPARECFTCHNDRASYVRPSIHNSVSNAPRIVMGRQTWNSTSAGQISAGSPTFSPRALTLSTAVKKNYSSRSQKTQPKVTEVVELLDDTEEEEKVEKRIQTKAWTSSPPSDHNYGLRSGKGADKKFTFDWFRQQYFQYPFGQRSEICVQEGDRACLRDGEFLNDVIIDFYLRYVVLEVIPPEMRERVHVFSTFFYKKLTSRSQKGAGSNSIEIPEKFRDTKITPYSWARHQRVKNWIKKVDIFEKDFVVVPICEQSHWFVAIVCYPNRIKNKKSKSAAPVPKEMRNVDSQSTTRDSGEGVHSGLRSAKVEAEMAGQADTGTKTRAGYGGAEFHAPCVVVLDSLYQPESNQARYQTTKNLKEFMKVELLVRHEQEEDFGKQEMPGCYPEVPQQANFSDCGVYLLLFVEYFLTKTPSRLPISRLNTGWIPQKRIDGMRTELKELLDRLQEQFLEKLTEGSGADQLKQEEGPEAIEEDEGTEAIGGEDEIEDGDGDGEFEGSDEGRNGAEVQGDSFGDESAVVPKEESAHAEVSDRVVESMEEGPDEDESLWEESGPGIG